MTQKEKLFLQSILQKEKEYPCRFGGKEVAGKFIRTVFSILFPGFYEHKIFADTRKLEDKYLSLKNYLDKLIIGYLPIETVNLEKKAKDINAYFLNSLADVYEKLWKDASAAWAGDPAAKSLQEVILAYPGFMAIAIHRLAHTFYKAGCPIFPRLLTEYAHEKTGIDIHPAAQIGDSFFMDHGTGIVIGETSQIADNVKIYQGVTLGALSVAKDMAVKKRHPTIQEGVVIYAGATILGGETVIGRNSVIGGNTWITESVPPNSIVYYKSEVRFRAQKESEPVIDFSI